MYHQIVLLNNQISAEQVLPAATVIRNRCRGKNPLCLNYIPSLKNQSLPGHIARLLEIPLDLRRECFILAQIQANLIILKASKFIFMPVVVIPKTVFSLESGRIEYRSQILTILEVAS